MANQIHLVGLVFKGARRGIAQRTVQTLAVVEDFNVLKDGGPSCLPGGEALAVNEFHFQGAPEGFHGGIVITVALAAHRRLRLAAGQGLAKISTGILAAAIGVEDQLRSRLALALGHLPGGQDQPAVNGLVHGPADDAAAESVEDQSRRTISFARVLFFLYPQHRLRKRVNSSLVAASSKHAVDLKGAGVKSIRR